MLDSTQDLPNASPRLTPTPIQSSSSSPPGAAAGQRLPAPLLWAVSTKPGTAAGAARAQSMERIGNPQHNLGLPTATALLKPPSTGKPPDKARSEGSYHTQGRGLPNPTSRDPPVRRADPRATEPPPHCPPDSLGLTTPHYLSFPSTCLHPTTLAA